MTTERERKEHVELQVFQAKSKGNKDPGHNSSPVNTTQHDKQSPEEKAPWENLGSKNPDPFRHLSEN